MDRKDTARIIRDKEYQKKKYEYRKENGLCTRCGKPLSSSEYFTCDNCRNVKQLYRKKKAKCSEIWGEVNQTRHDTKEELKARKEQQKKLRQDIIDAKNAGMSYGYWMAKKYMEENKK